MVQASAATPRRIAMWSGPRNISTALMRSWDSRPDTAVVDEPFYAHYLKVTGLEHPGREAVLASQDTDWKRVAATLAGPVPGGKAIWYQKHMAHHLLPDMLGDWLLGFTHVFLLRDPEAMLASLDRILETPTLSDTGLPQQVMLLDWLEEKLGTAPPVIDAADILAAPEAGLRALCRAVEVDFDPRMLSWEPGPRDTDGVWAEHWYGRVIETTGFLPPASRTVELPLRLAGLAADCRKLHARLAVHRLRVEPSKD